MDKVKEILKQYDRMMEANYWEWGKKGWKIMTKAKDLAHTEEHVVNILKNLEKFLVSKEVEVKKIDFEVLMTAIIWHDVWKSTHLPTNPWAIIRNQFWEGWGSARVFGKAIDKKKITAEKLKKIVWAIRNHQAVKTPFGDSLESRILQDMDRLERWSRDRANMFFPAFRSYFMIKNKTVMQILEKVYIKFYMPFRDGERKYNFEWSKREYRRRRKEWINII